MNDLPEPWLRGPIPSLTPLLTPILFSFQQAREDLAKYTDGLTTDQIWATPFGFGSVGFHLRHIAGSTERLMTYVEGKRLSDAQMTAMRQEKNPARLAKNCWSRSTQRFGRPKQWCARSIPRLFRNRAKSEGSACPRR